jgi:hypothetical protein
MQRRPSTAYLSLNLETLYFYEQSFKWTTMLSTLGFPYSSSSLVMFTENNAHDQHVKMLETVITYMFLSINGSVFLQVKIAHILPAFYGKGSLSQAHSIDEHSCK